MFYTFLLYAIKYLKKTKKKTPRPPPHPLEYATSTYYNSNNSFNFSFGFPLKIKYNKFATKKNKKKNTINCWGEWWGEETLNALVLFIITHTGMSAGTCAAAHQIKFHFRLMRARSFQNKIKTNFFTVARRSGLFLSAVPGAEYNGIEVISQRKRIWSTKKNT